MIAKENESRFIFGTLGLFFSGFISFISIISLIIGFEINSWGVVGEISTVGINGLDSFFLAVPFLIIGMIGLIIGLPSFMVSILNLLKSVNKNEITEKIRLANKKEILKRTLGVSILSIFIIVIMLSRGETYTVWEEETDCSDDINTYHCDDTNPSNIERQVDNIFYDENGEINIILPFLFWIILTSAVFVISIKEMTSEHVLSGKCMAKKKNGKGYCSRKQLPNKLYCKQHLEENRFGIKKQG